MPNQLEQLFKIDIFILDSGAPAFFAKAEMGSVRFQQRKICWRLLPSAARVRPASAAAHNSPSVRCTPLAYANDLTPCRMALHFDYASAIAPTSSKRPAPTATRGSSYTAPLALRFLYSFAETVPWVESPWPWLPLELFESRAVVAGAGAGPMNLKTVVEHIPANKNQHKLDKEN